MAEAIEAETARREIEHNDGSMYPPCEKLPGAGAPGWLDSVHSCCHVTVAVQGSICRELEACPRC